MSQMIPKKRQNIVIAGVFDTYDPRIHLFQCLSKINFFRCEFYQQTHRRHDLDFLYTYRDKVGEQYG